MTPRRAAALGAVLWIIVCALVRPHPYDEAWARGLLCLAPAVLLPLWVAGPAPVVEAICDRWLPRGPLRFAWWLVAVLALGVANAMPRGTGAALAAAPWIAMLFAVGVGSVIGLLRSRRFPRADEAAQFAAPLFGAVGGTWLAFDRLGLQPLDLPAEIVLLTAIHFHFAGIVLPLVASWIESGARGPRAWITVSAALGGVPLVALGITATQLGAPRAVEAVAALTMSAGGLWIAWRMFREATRSEGPARVLTRGAALCLAAGMVLAAAYGVRNWIEFAWMGVPWMRGVHGSLNALGFGLGAGLAACLTHAQESHEATP